MAIMNFRIGTLTERSGQAARRVTQYLQREGVYAPQEVGYVLRTTEETAERGDFVTQAVGNLPGWAQGDAAMFFTAAEAYERGGRERAGRWATTWQIALPKELTREEQWTMGHAFIARQLEGHAYLCVMHDPIKDGNHQPHLHVLFSERTDHGHATDARTYFRRPDAGGCAKDRWFNQRSSVNALRESWADWHNYTLERLGHPERIHPHSLYVRTIDRKPEPKVGYSRDERRHAERVRIKAQRDVAQEQSQASAAWELRKQRIGLTNVHDQEPAAMLNLLVMRARQQGVSRQHSWWTHGKVTRHMRRVERQHTLLQRVRETLEAAIARTKTELRIVERSLQRLTPTRSAGQRQDESHGQGYRVRLHEEERKHERTHTRGW